LRGKEGEGEGGRRERREKGKEGEGKGGRGARRERGKEERGRDILNFIPFSNIPYIFHNLQSQS
jgi:hypothetical protein